MRTRPSLSNIVLPAMIRYTKRTFPGINSMLFAKMVVTEKAARRTTGPARTTLNDQSFLRNIRKMKEIVVCTKKKVIFK